MSLRLIIRIQEQFATLPPSEQRLATYILDNERTIIGLSAAEISRASGVSKSTATRFFKSLGYESFETVRQQARSELNRAEPVTADPSRPQRQPRPRSVEAYLGQEIQALTRTLEGISSDTLRAAVQLLAEAPCLWTGGPRDDDPLARMLVTLMGPVRPNVRLISGFGQPPEHQLASFRSGDALLLFGMTGRSKPLDLIADQALSAGLHLLFVTNHRGVASPGSHIVIRCQVREGREMSYLTPVVSLLGLLSDRVAARLGPRAERHRKLLASFAVY
jgi:DNA-binding MurR/RpiR family transcriptional regulator